MSDLSFFQDITPALSLYCDDSAWVYALYRGQELIYIGCTEDLRRRLREHVKRMRQEVLRVWFLPCAVPTVSLLVGSASSRGQVNPHL